METDVMNVAPYKLKLCSKKLASGKFQVKFYVSKGTETQDMYGYVLVDAKDTLKACSIHHKE